jgi:hypothetical protein
MKSTTLFAIIILASSAAALSIGISPSVAYFEIHNQTSANGYFYASTDSVGNITFSITKSGETADWIKTNAPNVTVSNHNTKVDYMIGIPNNTSYGNHTGYIGIVYCPPTNGNTICYGVDQVIIIKIPTTTTTTTSTTTSTTTTSTTMRNNHIKEIIKKFILNLKSYHSR